ncbi:MAG: HlyD family secretion protein [Burkholderiaceae bacterium]
MSEPTPPRGEQRSARRSFGRVLGRLLLLIAVPLAAIAIGLYFYSTGGRYVSTENAYVRADIIAISADIGGRVTAVAVADNQRVVRGSELFRLDAEPLRAQVGEAEAELQLAKVSIDSMRADYLEAMAAIRSARQQVGYLQRRLERQEKLTRRGVVSDEKYEQAIHELRVATQQVAALDQRARRALTNLGGDIEIAYEAHPAFQAALHRLELARTHERQTIVRAPADGIISNMRLQAGEFVEKGKPVFSLVNDSDLWVEANLKETQLTHLAAGQHATLTVDAYPGIEWQAVVSDIAPTTGAEFSLLPPQNATGNWVKVVQRVPVRLRIEPRPDSPPLRVGMTVTATIDTERQRGWPLPFGDGPGPATPGAPANS